MLLVAVSTGLCALMFLFIVLDGMETAVGRGERVVRTIDIMVCHLLLQDALSILEPLLSDPVPFVQQVRHVCTQPHVFFIPTNRSTHSHIFFISTNCSTHLDLTHLG